MVGEGLSVWTPRDLSKSALYLTVLRAVIGKLVLVETSRAGPRRSALGGVAHGVRGARGLRPACPPLRLRGPPRPPTDPPQR